MHHAQAMTTLSEDTLLALAKKALRLMKKHDYERSQALQKAAQELGLELTLDDLCLARRQLKENLSHLMDSILSILTTHLHPKKGRAKSFDTAFNLAARHNGILCPEQCPNLIQHLTERCQQKV